MEEQFIILLICAEVPNQKFYDGNDFVSSLDAAKIYSKYVDAVREQQNIIENSPEKIGIYRAPVVDLATYKRILHEHFIDPYPKRKQ